MPMPRHGVAGAVIGNRFHLVSGMIQSAGALTFLDPKLATHTAMHDILELQFDPPPPTAATKAEAPPSTVRSTVRRLLSIVKRERRLRRTRGTASSGGRRSPTPATTSTAPKAR